MSRSTRKRQLASACGLPGARAPEPGDAALRELGRALRAQAPEIVHAVPAIAPAAARAGLVDVAYALEETPLGRLLLASSERGLVRIAYLDASGREREETALEQLAAELSPRILRAPRRLDPVRRELEQYFAGRRRRFELKLDWRLVHGGFGRRVLAATAAIPYGATRTYRQVAQAAGSPRAYRAAGNALGANPLPIVVPCHRVLASGGGLGGYTGGLERKQALLAIERGEGGLTAPAPTDLAPRSTPEASLPPPQS
jgi:methylated-DNA-[protein]-cysteine S-methyltransferase